MKMKMVMKLEMSFTIVNKVSDVSHDVDYYFDDNDDDDVDNDVHDHCDVNDGVKLDGNMRSFFPVSHWFFKYSKNA